MFFGNRTAERIINAESGQREKKQQEENRQDSCKSNNKEY